MNFGKILRKRDQSYQQVGDNEYRLKSSVFSCWQDGKRVNKSIILPSTALKIWGKQGCHEHFSSFKRALNGYNSAISLDQQIL